ncbi:monosaccharide ABC transporter substrate-binding protein, CUT2 family [Faunimonas pinastri]|uniref:Monosaccharide ABC transporter substrate-binding protein, CUT2 family n=1 Tax=Faunimonas pinastri TaxID=1855383 RepID=A0A1H9CLC4_9HYPH|nr:ABC transporter substrate-binding protein [Faunimonas pinastri]SEQ01847.1 monosaccharide ABC transporter substrate-binding protein, CUT2 family [Faunimonas pinastri]
MLKKLLLAGVAITMVAGVAQAKDLNKIGVSLGSMGNPFFVALANGATAQAKESNPKAEVTALGYDYDLGKQFTQIDNFIAAGDDLILLNPGDPVAIAPAIKRAQAAGVPVVAVDTAAQGADATVTTDNVKAGELACQYLVDKLGGKGNVVIVNGPHVSAVIDRVKGCHNVLDKQSGIKILSDDQDAHGSRDGGLAVMQGLLTRFDKIDGVFGINDPTSIGADLAAKQLNRKEMIITSVDGAPDIVAALEGDTLIQASAAQDPFGMAKKATEVGIGIINGKKPEQDPILIPPTLVTRDNVKDYKGWTGH